MQIQIYRSLSEIPQTVPQQSLVAMNHPFIAERITKLTNAIKSSDTVTSIERLYAALYQRKPTALELQLATQFINSDPARSIEGSPDAAETRASRWSYGYGEFDATTGKVLGFTPLPYFSGTAWQGGSSFPDAALGWVQLSAAGGHPGNDLKHGSGKKVDGACIRQSSHPFKVDA